MSAGRRARAVTLLSGGAPDPPVCMQTYLGLFLEPRRREALAAVYGEMLGGAGERELSFEELVEAQFDAWERAWSVLQRPPAWMPTRFGPTRAAGGTRIMLREGRVLSQAPGGEPVDVIDAPKGSTTDVWDRRSDVASRDPDRIAPVEDAAAHRQSGTLELPRRAVERWGDEYLVYGSVGAAYWSAYSALGFAGLMETMRSGPELLAEIIANRTRTLCGRLDLLAEAGVECIFTEECLSSSDLISEEDYLRFSLPAARELLQHARDLGLRTVYYCCGGVEDRLEHLAELPADVLAFEESKKGFEIDLGQVRRAIGDDRSLLGNIDATLLRDGSEETIRRAVRAQFDAAGPLLATSLGSPVTLDTEPWRIDAMVAATEQVQRG
ncbi:MAG: uroporphyrinogen decarboxylase family protein [Armatimonadota bacterium]|nr:uroporphyrinogen decarboxylase family protein [Armatimonadota bacterium]